MITYYTGLPGAGKTLNFIKDALTDPQYKGRPVFYYGIENCSLTDWTEIDTDQLNRWYELPEGSVILIDEVQREWRVRGRGAAVPKHIQELETHRHYGMDFLVTSQFPRQTDTFFRGLVGRHYHYERQFGFNMLRRFEFQRCIADPVEDYHARKDAITTSQKLDKKYFGLYKSADVHTHKPRIPKKLIVIGLTAVVFGVIVFMLPSVLMSKPEVTPHKQETIDSMVNSITDPLKANKSTPAGEFVQIDYGMFRDSDTLLHAMKPIIPNKPDTAPIYATLHEPVSKPRPNCLSHWINDRLVCTCYSQQATKLAIEHEICVYYVNNGYEFDYTRPDYDKEPSAPEEGDLPPRADQINTINPTTPPKYPNSNNSYAGIR